MTWSYVRIALIIYYLPYHPLSDNAHFDSHSTKLSLVEFKTDNYTYTYSHRVMGLKWHYACENPYVILHQYLSRFDLKTFTDFDDITYSGSLFQALITRWLKKFTLHL